MNKDYYYYTIPVLRAVEESLQTGCLMLGRKGMEFEIAGPFSFAEYRCDYEMALDYVKRHGLFREHWSYTEGRKKLTYKTVKEMVSFLNGQ